MSSPISLAAGQCAVYQYCHRCGLLDTTAWRKGAPSSGLFSRSKVGREQRDISAGGFLSGRWLIHEEYALEFLCQEDSFPFSPPEFPG
jgi:hypothetical protein